MSLLYDDDDNGDDDGEGEEKGGGVSKASLYEAPREARLSILSASNAGCAGGDASSSALEPRGAGLGGDDDARGAVGLVEVALSAEDRLSNIERTEAAKQRARAAAVAAAAAGSRGGGGGAIFNSHAAASASSRGGAFGDDGVGFRRRDLPTAFGGGKRR